VDEHEYQDALPSPTKQRERQKRDGRERLNIEVERLQQIGPMRVAVRARWQRPPT